MHSMTFWLEKNGADQDTVDAINLSLRCFKVKTWGTSGSVQDDVPFLERQKIFLIVSAMKGTARACNRKLTDVRSGRLQRAGPSGVLRRSPDGDTVHSPGRLERPFSLSYACCTGYGLENRTLFDDALGSISSSFVPLSPTRFAHVLVVTASLVASYLGLACIQPIWISVARRFHGWRC